MGIVMELGWVLGWVLAVTGGVRGRGIGVVFLSERWLMGVAEGRGKEGRERNTSWAK